MTLSKFYVNIEPPQSKKVLWIKPLQDGFALYIWFKDKWQLLKVLDDNGTPIIWDDITLDFYTKDQIDDMIGDIETLLAAI